jgi:hypothetical protein
MEVVTQLAQSVDYWLKSTHKESFPLYLIAANQLFVLTCDEPLSITHQLNFF